MGAEMKPTAEQIEAFRKEHHIPGVDDLEPWAIEENMVLAYLCDLAARAEVVTQLAGAARHVLNVSGRINRSGPVSLLDDLRAAEERLDELLCSMNPQPPEQGEGK